MTMSTTTTAVVSAEQQVREQVLRWQQSFIAKDVDAMMSFYTGESFTAFDLMPPLEFHGGPMWRENWERFFASFDGAIELEISGMEISAGGDLAVMRALVRLAGNMGGADLNTWVRQTNCFRLVDGQWLMFHDHVSWPTDFATGRSLTDLVPAR